jgi:regulator of cell morphogenesis and NO signaling
MSLNTAMTVRELVAAHPQAVRILDQSGIEYCCKGDRPLQQACAELGIDAGKLLEEIENSWQQPGRTKDWNAAPLSELIDHIVQDFHEPARAELERIFPLANRVASVHSERHPELIEVVQEFAQLRGEFTMHMRKEELMLFPWIVKTEAQREAPGGAGTPPFGSFRNPIGTMIAEHSVSGDELERLRQLCNGYEVPEDACTSYQALYAALRQFEADMHHHIHLENNILFPRAIALEQQS